jgi:multiple sugar transport system substrate-binding protein
MLHRLSYKSVKNLTAALLIAVPLVAFTTASAQEEISGDITFIFWEVDENARESWQNLVTAFNEEHPEIEVNLLAVPGESWAEYLERIATLIAGGERPDIIWVATEGVRFLASLNLLEPLDERIERDQEELRSVLGDVAPALLESFKVEGNTFALPYSWNAMFMYYNSARFEEAGLEPPSADWTWDDFLLAAEALTVDEDGDGYPERFGYAVETWGMFALQPWLLSGGGSILSEDLCEATLTDPGVVRALQFLYDLVYTHQVSPAPGAGIDAFAQFMNGNIGMLGAGRWLVKGFLQEDFQDYNIQYWPGNIERTSVYGVDGFPLLRMSQSPDAAWEFIKYMTKKEVQEGLVGGEEGVGTNIPTRRSVANQLTSPENAEIFYGVLDRDVELVTSPTNFNQMQNIFLRYVGLIFADEMTVEEAMQAAQAEMQGVIRCE